MDDVYLEIEKLRSRVVILEAEDKRNSSIRLRLKVLEDDKLIRDTTIKNAVLIFKILAGLNFSAIIFFVIMILKYLSK